MLCETIENSGIDVTYDDDDEYQFIKSKNPKLGIKFNSANKHRGYHKSRLTPDIKFMQSLQCPDGKYQAKDTNDITEWIVAAYIAKTQIYLLMDFSTDGGTTWVKKSWYNDSNAKVYYLKGILKNLDIQPSPGHLWKLIFTFEESWA